MRRRKRPHDPVPEVDLPITPMLDLAFQVLLFFILTYHPSQVEVQMDMSLPDLAQAQAASPKDAKPDKSATGELELPAEITVVVKTPHDGKNDGILSQITVQERQGSHEIVKPAGGDRDWLAGLRDYLARVRPGLANQSDVRLQAEGMLKYSKVMEVMDACTQAGFKNVGFGPPPDLGAAIE